MKVEITRTLPDKTLSKFRIRDMRPDEVIVAVCDDESEFMVAHKTAYNAKIENKRIDGFAYKVQSSKKDNTITISLFKEE